MAWEKTRPPKVNKRGMLGMDGAQQLNQEIGMMETVDINPQEELSPIEKLLEEQRREANVLHDAIGDLATEIASVLRPEVEEPPAPSSSDVIRSAPNTELGKDIEKSTARIIEAQDWIRNLTSRIEL